MSSFVFAGGRLSAAWPGSRDDAEYRQVRTSSVATLLIGGALDFATPPQTATRELLPYLPNGQQVVLHGFGHTGLLLNGRHRNTVLVWRCQGECGARQDDELSRSMGALGSPGNSAAHKSRGAIWCGTQSR